MKVFDELWLDRNRHTDTKSESQERIAACVTCKGEGYLIPENERGWHTFDEELEPCPDCGGLG